jgi:hypothetical protein
MSETFWTAGEFSNLIHTRASEKIRRAGALITPAGNGSD